MERPVPLLDAASLEDDPRIREMWQALLDRAANPTGPGVQPGLVDVLKRLSPDDAVLFDHLVESASATPMLSARTFDKISLSKTAPIMDQFRINVAIDDLLRERILAEETHEVSGGIIGGGSAANRQERAAQQVKTRLRITAFGSLFAYAVGASPSIPAELRT